MLVLSRKPQEKIVIGDGITVTVVRIEGEQVKLGITAPDDVNIRRAELPDESASDAPDGLIPSEPLITCLCGEEFCAADCDMPAEVLRGRLVCPSCLANYRKKMMM